MLSESYIVVFAATAAVAVARIRKFKYKHTPTRSLCCVKLLFLFHVKFSSRIPSIPSQFWFQIRMDWMNNLLSE